MSTWSPSADELLAWLDGDRPDLDVYVDTHEECLPILEELADAPEDDAGRLKGVLSRILAPPEGLTERMQDRIERARRDRETLDLMRDLFGIGWQTARLFVSDDDDHSPDSGA